MFVKNKDYFEIVDHDFVADDGKYKLYALPGEYAVAAYVDTNGDEVYQRDEPATYLGIEDKIPVQFQVNAGEEVMLDEIQISGIIEHRAVEKFTSNTPKFVENIGRVVTLDDPIFSRENASMGMWRPIDFIDSVGGGLFLLEDYEENKVPVLFIHGITGTPIEWREIITSMDRDRFQPWVLYYPSGVSLDVISDYIVQAVNTLEKRFKFKQMNVVAHSMGGLLMRSYIMKHSQVDRPWKISTAMTINSPMAGMSSAKSGVDHSPIVVPSWRDVAKDSAFIQNITAWDWPAEIPYHLVFSYKPGEGDDGVVSLESQFPSKLQREAVKIYGFNSSHAGVLQDAGFINIFNTLLDDSVH